MDLKTNLNFRNQLKPIGLIKAKSIQFMNSNKVLKVLFDTGSDTTFISRKALPKGCNPKTVTNFEVMGIGGKKPHNQSVVLKDIIFPEFSPTRKIDKTIKAIVLEDECPYDIILGVDVMVPLGIDVSCTTQTISWSDLKVSWKPQKYFDDSTLSNMARNSHAFYCDDPLSEWIDARAYYAQPDNGKLKESLYDVVPTKEITDQQLHLTSEQRNDLFNVLEKFKPLFNGNLVKNNFLGTYKGPKVRLELKKGAEPHSQRPYPVPHKHKHIFKQELDRLEEIGILSRTGPSEWLAPTFLIPKKDGRVRWITDFRQLNERIKRQVYNLPRIQDML